MVCLAPEGILSSSFLRRSSSNTFFCLRRAFVACKCSLASNGMATAAAETKLWGGRFEESVTPAVEKFSESVSYDRKLYKHDLQGSRAHASMLAQQVLFFFFFCFFFL